MLWWAIQQSKDLYSLFNCLLTDGGTSCFWPWKRWPHGNGNGWRNVYMVCLDIVKRKHNFSDIFYSKWSKKNLCFRLSQSCQSQKVEEELHVEDDAVASFPSSGQVWNMQLLMMKPRCTIFPRVFRSRMTSRTCSPPVMKKCHHHHQG